MSGAAGNRGSRTRASRSDCRRSYAGYGILPRGPDLFHHRGDQHARIAAAARIGMRADRAYFHVMRQVSALAGHRQKATRLEDAKECAEFDGAFAKRPRLCQLGQGNHLRNIRRRERPEFFAARQREWQRRPAVAHRPSGSTLRRESGSSPQAAPASPCRTAPRLRPARPISAAPHNSASDCSAIPLSGPIAAGYRLARRFEIASELCSVSREFQIGLSRRCDSFAAREWPFGAGM